MATFEVVVIKGEKKISKNTWNVKIRVIHNRVQAFISTKTFVVQSQLDDDLSSKVGQLIIYKS